MTFVSGHIIMEIEEGRRERRAMGIYVNPGNISFQEAINSKIYVDKSGLIPYTNSVIRTRQKNL